jgi:hypothetical protein
VILPNYIEKIEIVIKRAYLGGKQGGKRTKLYRKD